MAEFSLFDLIVDIDVRLVPRSDFRGCGILGRSLGWVFTLRGQVLIHHLLNSLIGLKMRVLVLTCDSGGFIYCGWYWPNIRLSLLAEL